MAEARRSSIKGILDGATRLVKGVYHPTLPLKATLREIKDVQVPVAWGSMRVVKGRGYVFGGLQEEGTLAENNVHIIHLPTTDFESTDYESLAPSSSAPPPRYGHSSALIDDQIYIYGGSSSSNSSSPTPINEDGKVHVFNTKTNSWSTLTPATSTRPPTAVFSAAIATDQPRPASETQQENDRNPKFSTARKDLLPKHELDPLHTLPEPVTANSYGTFVVYGGVTADGTPNNEIWAFDIAERIWSQLPSPPLLGQAPKHPNLALVANRIYTYAENKTYYLDLDLRSKAFIETGTTDLGLSPLAPWASYSSIEGSVSPGDRDGAALVPVTTGQGRNYLLLAGGNEKGDVWSLQLKSEGMSSASFKDAANQAVHRDSKEAVWAEVRYFNTEDKAIPEGHPGRGISGRVGFIGAKMGEIGGGALIVWGGLLGGKTRDDGVVIDLNN